MSSKVLPGGARTEAVAWRNFGGGAAAAADSLPPGDSRESAGGFEARISELEAQARRKEEQAFEAGFRKGQAAGQQQAAMALETAVAAFARAVQDLAGVKRRLRREAEEDLVKLSLAIARRVLRRELSIDPAALEGVVSSALKRLEAQEVECVRVYPADAPLVEKHLAQLGVGDRIQVKADPKLERGAALFETSRGALDASIETQLEEIGRGLADRLNGGAA